TVTSLQEVLRIYHEQ
ncbi:bacterial extracellular solute-binding family protein, partial [Vibrio parahaemolyticus EKP-021]